jgi:hypothetical protein
MAIEIDRQRTWTPRSHSQVDLALRDIYLDRNRQTFG